MPPGVPQEYENRIFGVLFRSPGVWGDSDVGLVILAYFGTWVGFSSTSNMTGQRFHCTREAILRRPWKSKSPFVYRPVKTSTNEVTQRVRTRHDAALLPLISIVWSPGRPVIWVPNFCSLAKSWVVHLFVNVKKKTRQPCFLKLRQCCPPKPPNAKN